MFCRYCGKKLDDDSVFCIHCGKKILEGEHSVSNQERNVPQMQDECEDDQLAIIKTTQPTSLEESAAEINGNYPKINFWVRLKGMCRYLSVAGWLGFVLFIFFSIFGALGVALSLVRLSVEPLFSGLMLLASAGCVYVLVLHQFWRLALVAHQLCVQLPDDKSDSEWMEEIQHHFSYPKVKSIRPINGKMMIESPRGLTEVTAEGHVLRLRITGIKDIRSGGYWELKHAFEADEIKNAIQCFVNRQPLPQNFQQIQSQRAKDRVGLWKVGIIIAVAVLMVILMLIPNSVLNDISSRFQTDASFEPQSMMSVPESSAESDKPSDVFSESTWSASKSTIESSVQTENYTLQSEAFRLDLYDVNALEDDWIHYQKPLPQEDSSMETAVFIGDQTNYLGDVLAAMFEEVTWQDVTPEGSQGSSYRFAAKQGNNQLTMDFSYLGMGSFGGGGISAGTIMLENGSAIPLSQQQCASLLAAIYHSYHETYGKVGQSFAQQLVGTWQNPDASTELEIDLYSYAGSPYQCVGADASSLYIEITREDGTIELRRIEWIDSNTFNLYYSEWDNSALIDSFYRAS